MASSVVARSLNLVKNNASRRCLHVTSAISKDMPSPTDHATGKIDDIDTCIFNEDMDWRFFDIT